MDDREPFNLEKSHECIHRICEACDGYTLMERWWALRCLEVSARALLGDKVMEFMKEEEDRLRESSSEPIEVEATAE